MLAGDPPEVQVKAKDDASGRDNDTQARPTLEFSADTASPDADKTGIRPDIEGYKIIEPLGEGGMGIVWRAEQLSTKRQVALKIMAAPRFASEKAQGRFEREVELTARLDHPNIARIYESGLHHGLYYYAMELVDGMPLDRYVKSKGLSKNEILALMQKVCQAVLYAHLRAVIHRDLKPSNILVSPDGQPHVLDFGLAKALLDEDEALTISIEGQVAGTPAYMSPEQAAGHHSQTDTRTDVFSLGVILYELLTGQAPHDHSGSMFDLLQQITEGKIRRPREANKSIDAELEAILLKALARDPEERYASAGALAKDITSYLDEEPLDARLPTTLYFLRKKVRKYRVQVGAVVAVLALLLGTILVAYTRVVAEKAVRDAQETELDLKSKKLTWAELELKALSGDRAEALAALGILRDEYVSAQNEVSQLNHRLGERQAPVAVRRIDLVPGPAIASTALVRAPSLPGGVESWTLETRGHRGRIARLAYSPDSRQLISAGNDGTVRTWDALSGQLLQVLVDPNSTAELSRLADHEEVGRFSWSIDDATRTVEETSKLWRVDMGAGWQPLLRTATAIAMFPDRSTLAMGDRDGTIRVVNPESGQLRHTQIPSWCGPIRSACFSPDGRVLAACAGPGTICLWDTHRWEPLRKFEADGITADSSSTDSPIAWAPNGAAIARVNGKQQSVEIADSQSGSVLRILSAPAHGITALGWSPDGRLVVAGTMDGRVYSWDLMLDSNEPLATMSAHTGSLNALAWMSQDQNLITAGDDGKINIWEPRSRVQIRSIEGYPAPITCLALSPDDKTLAAGSENGIIRLWDAAGGWTSRLLRGEPNDVEARESKFTAVAWSPDGTLLSSGDSVGNIRIWDPNSRRSTRSFAANCGPISSLVWSPDDRVLLCGGADGTIRVWDAKSDFHEHVVLLPLWGSVGPGIAVNAAGDYRGPPGIEDHLINVVRTAESRQTLKSADFQSQYGWVNEPWQVGLYKPGAEIIERIYVNAASEGPYDGKTWQTAFSDLQDALTIAQPNTEIWVAAGTYTPDRGTGARTASFHLKNGVRLLGGFAGTETSSYQRDPKTCETILSGDLKGDDGPDFAKNDENSYHVVIAVRTNSDTVLDGFTITGGNADGPGEQRYNEGGGVYTTDGGMTLISCTLRFNAATRPGGGLYHSSNQSNLSLTACIFSNNRAVIQNGHGWGGGIYIGGAKGAMNDCTLERNVAGDGGGAFLSRTSNFVLRNCTFVDNRAISSGGGLRGYTENNYALVNCRFVRNSDWFHGGGVFNGGESKATLVNCIFVGNSSRHGA
ncbi:MAG: protein kinase, partial [Phycisphaerales bacterium]